jgi:chromosome partitioning protein
VLIVDGDPQGNTTTGFGIEKARIERDLYDVLMQQASIEDVLLPTEIDGLHIVPATINLAGAEIELVSGLSRETRLRTAVTPIASRYDFVLIDCPPSLGLLTINALTAADEIIIPVQAEFYALEGLSQLTNVVRRVREALNPTLHVSGVLVTMFDGRTRLAMEVLDELERFFPQQMFKTQIPRNIRLSEAPSYGKPVILFDIKSRGAQAYLALAREMLELEAATQVRA